MDSITIKLSKANAFSLMHERRARFYSPQSNLQKIVLPDTVLAIQRALNSSDYVNKMRCIMHNSNYLMIQKGVMAQNSLAVQFATSFMDVPKFSRRIQRYNIDNSLISHKVSYVMRAFNKRGSAVENPEFIVNEDLITIITNDELNNTFGKLSSLNLSDYQKEKLASIICILEKVSAIQNVVSFKVAYEIQLELSVLLNDPLCQTLQGLQSAFTFKVLGATIGSILLRKALIVFWNDFIKSK